MKKRCTDCYGKIDERLKPGVTVENNHVKFVVGSVDVESKIVTIDMSKELTIKTGNHSIIEKIALGEYEALAASLVFSEVDTEV